MKLVEVFTANEWEIPNEEAGMESRFNRFCERLCTLDAEEQRLVIELTRRFTAIGGAEYPQLILKLMNRLHSQKLPVFSEAGKVFILLSRRRTVAEQKVPVLCGITAGRN